MSRPCSYGLSHQARAIAAQLAHTEGSRWLVGTNSLREDNVVQVLALDEEKDAVKVVSTHKTPAEVWQLAPSPTEAGCFAAVHSTRGAFGASIFALPEAGTELDLRKSLEGHEGEIRCLRWHPRNATLLASVDDGTLHIWTVTNESAKVWDLRSMKKSAEKDAAHSATVRDLDFSSETSHLLASCGDDCRVKVWDLRAFSRPLTEAASHAHWVWQSKFNPTHDQLLLSSSSDAVVSLLHMPSLAAKKVPAAGKDGCVATFDAHEDSVHGVAWSAVDPWTFASLSYDGRFVINRVPSNVKYKILI